MATTVKMQGLLDWMTTLPLQYDMDPDDPEHRHLYNMKTIKDAFNNAAKAGSLRVTAVRGTQTHHMVFETEGERDACRRVVDQHHNLWKKFNPACQRGAAKRSAETSRARAEKRNARTAEQRHCVHPGCTETAPRGTVTATFPREGSRCKKHPPLKNDNVMPLEEVDAVDADGAMSTMLDWRRRCKCASLVGADGTVGYSLVYQGQILESALNADILVVEFLHGKAHTLRMAFPDTEVMCEVLKKMEACDKVYTLAGRAANRVTPEETLTSLCLRCSVTKPLSEFYPESLKRCKDCKKSKQKAGRAAHIATKEAERVVVDEEGPDAIAARIVAWRVALGGVDTRTVLDDAGNATQVTNLARVMMTMRGLTDTLTAVLPATNTRDRLCVVFPSRECMEATLVILQRHDAVYHKDKDSTGPRKDHCKRAAAARNEAMSPISKRQRTVQGEDGRRERVAALLTQGTRKCRGNFSGCGRILPLDAFKYTARGAGVVEHRDADTERTHSVCIECFPKQHECSQRYEATRERDMEVMRAYEQRPEVQARRIVWKLQHPEAAQLYLRRYRESNREMIREKQRAYREMNRESIRQYNRAYRDTDQYKQYISTWGTQINNAISVYKYACVHSNGIKEWNLTDDEAVDLLSATECYYCGTENGVCDASGMGQLLLGIDRMDSEAHYTIHNTVPCCPQCNYAKGIHTAEQFIRLCYNVTHFQLDGTAPEEPVSHYQTHDAKANGHASTGTTFRAYMYSAKKSGRDFDLTERVFNEMRTAPCAYCGTQQGTCGVDRIDPNLDYHLQNCCACCSACNMAKSDTCRGGFLNMCADVVNTHM